MLNDADISRFYHVYVFVGKTALRKGIDGLSTLVNQKFQLDPFHAGDLFLFCGSSNREIKGLVWEEDGFLLIYKRLEAGTFQWLRSEAEARNITSEQYHLSIRSIQNTQCDFCTKQRSFLFDSKACMGIKSSVFYPLNMNCGQYSLPHEK